MKKLYISCPVRGRTSENIKASVDKMHKIAEILAGEELEVISPPIWEFGESNAPENCRAGIWDLGESIKKMSEADYFIKVNYVSEYERCFIEQCVANSYHINTFALSMFDVAPDLSNVEYYAQRGDYDEQ